MMKAAAIGIMPSSFDLRCGTSIREPRSWPFLAEDTANEIRFVMPGYFQASVPSKNRSEDSSSSKQYGKCSLSPSTNA
jgi:hypothetical protein